MSRIMTRFRRCRDQMYFSHQKIQTDVVFSVHAACFVVNCPSILPLLCVEVAVCELAKAEWKWKDKWILPPRRHCTRTFSRDDKTLCLRKQPIITMMNGCGCVAIVSLALILCGRLSIWDESSMLLLTIHAGFWSIVSPINIQLPRAGLIAWERGRRRFRKVTYVQWRLTVAGPSIGWRGGGELMQRVHPGCKAQACVTGWRWTFSCCHRPDGKHCDMSWCLQVSEWWAGWFFWGRSFCLCMWRRDVKRSNVTWDGHDKYSSNYGETHFLQLFFLKIMCDSLTHNSQQTMEAQRIITLLQLDPGN